MKFKEIGEQIDAIKFDGTNMGDLKRLFGADIIDVNGKPNIRNAGNNLKQCRSGCWVLKNRKGGFSLHSDSDFKLLFEAVV